MISWYRKVQEDGLDEITEALMYYEKELENAKKDLEISGSAIAMSGRLPGIMQYRYSQLQDLCAIYEYISILKNKTFSIKFKSFLSHYNKDISSRDAEKFANGEDDVAELAILLVSIGVVRDQYTGITKGLESKHYQLTNIMQLKRAGIDDFSINL